MKARIRPEEHLFSSSAEGYPPIGDYAIIGDCRCAALISREGSIDWLCLPRFDSPSVFASILDRQQGGRFSIRPALPFRAWRCYLDQTTVLETGFETRTGKLRLVDLMPVYPASHNGPLPERAILRLIECLEGKVEVAVEYEPRLDYGRAANRLRAEGQLGIHCQHGGKSLLLRSEIPLEISSDRRRAEGRLVLSANERRFLFLVFADGFPLVVPVLGDAANALVESTLAWWREWSRKCTYEGPFRQEVVRSALTLKLMTYAPSGAVVAAPTTSLPEKVGGIRNWDYRYCWLRDASMTLRAFFRLGYTAEGEAFFSWLTHSTRLTSPRLQVVYSIYGETSLPEREFSHLEGYRNSRPVRVGNSAERQLQLDIYGEVAEAALEFIRREGKLGPDIQRMLHGMGKAVCELWERPDEGIWEIRGGARHHTSSKAMCWVALDRLIKMHAAGHLKGSVEKFARERQKIRQTIEERGVSAATGSYRSGFRGEEVDASLLLLAIHGYTDPGKSRMVATYERIRRELGHDNLFYRYSSQNGLPPGEGAFALASFWAVEYLALRGGKHLNQAGKDFEQILSFANEVGLYGEEIDAANGLALGNFPQAYTHIGLINAATALAEAQDR